MARPGRKTIFRPEFDLVRAVEQTRERGYFFADNSMSDELLTSLESEVAYLKFEEGDHVNYPINKGTKTEVRQLHERSYHHIGSPALPFTSQLCLDLATLVRRAHGELAEWVPTEMGFQRYRNEFDWISPHRDRRSDQLFSVTFTITGVAHVFIHESSVDPPDYSKLEPVDSHRTKRGTTMFLRAPGFGSGEQVIHEVSPPLYGPRLILNLRMRPTMLESPREWLATRGYDASP